MNCPSHHLLFHSHKHSYRELPMRYVTFDVLHRNEISGALSGLTRVRQFSQDDCHVYLREDQIAQEVKFLMDFILGYYDTFGLTARLKFATRPEQRIGSDELWDRAESALRAALESTGRPYEMKEGDGAFSRPQDRLRRHGLDRARLAARDHPARLQRPGAVRPHPRARTTPRTGRS
ncbi:MAG: hypothetical protein IPJ78_19645 [Gemmatimonadetes bacterium]|nr:hypothetical protein [Gemmatimonadota bacterium]